jgi:outer membrane protein OmpA-like peptidoglycan-associated protein
MMLRSGVALAVALVAACELQAQRAGTIEVGLFPTIAYFDKALHLDQARAGPGARIGFFLSDRLAVEADGSWVPTKGRNGADVKYMPLHARLVFNFPAGESVGLLLGAGYSHTRIRDELRVTNHGASANAGIRLGSGDIASIRIDTYVDYIPSPDFGEENWNWGIQPGLSFMLGGRSAGPRDRDADGVPDDVDECKKTPAGDRVDAKGCTVKDADGDGVFDDADACAGTPAGDKVDEKGCSLPKDADGDGVVDAADGCADTPKGDKVDEKGCSLPKDADGDGVTDDVDTCADTPAGEQVDAKGCGPGQRDGDGDGVNDAADRCPSTPAGVDVDAEGCQVLFQPTKKTLILEGVTFETGKSTLTPESEAILNGVAESLVANDTIRVQVTGHTDNTGSLAVNRRLSRARADAVRTYLISRGVAESRLTARGFGPDQPVASNKTAEGRAQNRRVELMRLN